MSGVQLSRNMLHLNMFEMADDSCKSGGAPIHWILGSPPPPNELWTVGDGMGHVTNLPTCGLLPNLSPALKHRRPPKQQGLCSQSTHFWANGDFVPHFEVYETRDGRGYVANPPACGHLLIL